MPRVAGSSREPWIRLVLRSDSLKSTRVDGGHDDLRDLFGMGDHDDVRSTFDLRHRGPHALEAEAVDGRVNTPIGGRQHRPDRTATPRWGRRRLSERNTGKGSLADRVEGRVS